MGGADVEGVVVEAEAFIVVEVDCSRPGARSQVTAMTTSLRLLSLARNPCRRLLLSHFITPSLSDKPSRRTFVSTQPRRAAPAPTPATPAILRRWPTVEDIQTVELDVEPLAQGDAQLALTERAAQVCCDFDPRGEQF